MTPYTELSDREKLTLTIWDAWKDAYGYRPSHIDFDSMTDEDINELYLKVCDDIA